MDKYSEVEVKFAADKVKLKDFHKFVANQSSELLDKPDSIRIESFKSVGGDDYFYDLGGNVLRFRRDTDGGSEFTYKERKSQKSITDRIEINLPLAYGTPFETTHKLLTSLGAKPILDFYKMSYIYHISGYVAVGRSRKVYSGHVAMYSVYRTGKDRRQFLEVEIDSSSQCEPKVALKALDLWVNRIQKDLGLKTPLNSSLYEIYSDATP